MRPSLRPTIRPVTAPAAIRAFSASSVSGPIQPSAFTLSCVCSALIAHRPRVHGIVEQREVESRRQLGAMHPLPVGCIVDLPRLVAPERLHGGLAELPPRRHLAPARQRLVGDPHIGRATRVLGMVGIATLMREHLGEAAGEALRRGWFKH
jgi:hypothetical protein